MNVCGTDIVNTERFKSFLQRCGQQRPERLFTLGEWEMCFNKANRVQSLAARFAGKEAVLKLFKRGDNQYSLLFKDIEILNDNYGAPYVVMNKKLVQIMSLYAYKYISISLTHCSQYAQAVAITTAL